MMYSFDFHLRFEVKGISYESGYDKLEAVVKSNSPEIFQVWFSRQYFPALSRRRILKGSFVFKHKNFSDHAEKVVTYEPLVRACLGNVLSVKGVILHNLKLTIPHRVVMLPVQKSPTK